MLLDVSYQACSDKLLAANSSPIQILGSSRVSFRIAGVDLENEFLVSDAVDEIILGADWLSDNRCLGDFESSILWIRALATPRYVRLENTTQPSCVRRTYSKDKVELPPFSQSNVPVKSVWSSWPQCRVDWLVESKILRQGAILAGTLLAPNRDEACVRVLNGSPTPCLLPAGELPASTESVTANCGASDKSQDKESGEHVQCLTDALPQELRRRPANFRLYSLFVPAGMCSLTHPLILAKLDVATSDRYEKSFAGEAAFTTSALCPSDRIERDDQELLAANVTEPAASPWSFNVLPVRNGTMRFCVDFRKLNDLSAKGLVYTAKIRAVYREHRLC
jgi:hypothetical protein